MNNTQVAAIEETTVELAEEQLFELSLSELDMIGGGGPIVAMA